MRKVIMASPVINLYKERFVFLFLSVSSDTTDILFWRLESSMPAPFGQNHLTWNFLILVC